MRIESTTVLENSNTKDFCRHHWLIEPANGPSSLGKCKFCGEEKSFDNMLADIMSQKDVSEPFESDDVDADDDNLEIALAS